MCENLHNRKCLHQVGHFFCLLGQKKTHTQKTRPTSKYDMSDYLARGTSYEILKKKLFFQLFNLCLNMPWNKKMILVLINLQVDFSNMLVWIFVLAHTTKLGSSQ